MKSNGDCYRVASEMILTIDSDDAFLCQGFVTGQGKIAGVVHGHAWIEINGTVIDYSNGKKFIVKKDRYYKIGKIDDKLVTRFTRDETREKILETGYYEAWVKK